MIIDEDRAYLLLWDKGEGIMYSCYKSGKLIKQPERWQHHFDVKGFTLKQIRCMFCHLKVIDVNKEEIPRKIREIYDFDGNPIYMRL